MANSPKLRGTYDLLALVALTALLAICIFFVTWNVPRIILGLPLITFFPGYALLAAMVPRKGTIDGLQRLALSLALSLAMVPLIALALNYLWEISVYPMLVFTAGFVMAMCLVAFLRRMRLPPGERFEPQVKVHVPQWGQRSRLDKALAALLVVAVIGSVSTAIYVGVRPRVQEQFTDFYVLGPGGRIQYYPLNMVLGAAADVTVGVVNHEGKGVAYEVRVMHGATETQVLDPVNLRDGETWERAVTIAPAMAGDDQKVEFLLYRDGEPEPYQRLHLWVDVRDPSTPPSTP